ncbi:hypothetical protein PVK06_034684 [Gossypium arboreum]|uniref:Uncharacterized protein n=1 Tax=Gossypium arboreum TaxID=29729 RepID=A0ABR0NGZ9_GOSAR|nr:hypothetical protein PVK06_034684 [Gossypium arboreum]
MPQPTTPTAQPLQIMPGWNAWPGASPFPMTPTQPMICMLSSLKGSHEAPSTSSSHYQSSLPYGIQTPPPWVMQTPPHSLFYQGGSFSQHPQPEQSQPSPEQPQHALEVQPKRNPARIRQPPPCGTEVLLNKAE